MEKHLENLQRSIVLIDEDLPSRRFLSALLARWDYSIQSAASAKEGYITIMRNLPDIVICGTNLTGIPASVLMMWFR